MDVNEWISYECSDEGTSVRHIIHNLFTRSHASEEVRRRRLFINEENKELVYKDYL
jgi:hypothetical protein